MSSSDRNSGGRLERQFRTTEWSLVVAAADTGNPDVERALEALCRIYWRPVYAYVRRRGADADRARDLTQGFFARLLEKEYVKDVRREKGRFRTFLLTAVKHYLSHERERAGAIKRGEGRAPISLDTLDAEGAYALELADGATPETIYERRWARTLIATGMDALRREMSTPESERRFRLLSPYLSGEETTAYRDVATRLDMTESAVKVSVHRMRKRFRKLLREEVSRTVNGEGEVDAELRHLFAVLSA